MIKDEEKLKRRNDLIIFASVAIIFIMSVFVYATIFFRSSPVVVKGENSGTPFTFPEIRGILPSTSPTFPVNINWAGIEELTALPGIGREKALLIIQYRGTHGLFKIPSDIARVKGIRHKTYERIKDLIVVE